jgi:hypothetical protein
MYLTIISLTFLVLSNSVITNLQQKGYFFEYPRSAGGCILRPISYFRRKTRRSERILFVSRVYLHYVWSGN